MRHRNGDRVAQRLAECSLYDPALDLTVETSDGRIAGYSLYWFEPTTRVGLVEPVRVEAEFQRKGLGRVRLCEGIDRLVARGAERVKISYESGCRCPLSGRRIHAYVDGDLVPRAGGLAGGVDQTPPRLVAAVPRDAVQRYSLLSIFIKDT